jgi:tRNA threonylcarbamoyl adenosine modification protein YeaZ
MIIAIETASTDPSVALAEDDGSTIATDAWSSARRQEHELLPRLLALVDQSGRDIANASAIAVGIGPGSFTGLRVGMSVAKGLAYALQRPIVGIPSLSAWLEARPTAEAALVRAGASEAYLLLRGSHEPVVVPRDGLPEEASIADVAAPDELAQAFVLANAHPPYGAAAEVAKLAAAHLALDPSGDDLDSLQPAYLRGPRGIGLEPAGAVKWL